jgi:hypothetical protein
MIAEESFKKIKSKFGEFELPLNHNYRCKNAQKFEIHRNREINNFPTLLTQVLNKLRRFGQTFNDS